MDWKRPCERSTSRAEWAGVYNKQTRSVEALEAGEFKRLPGGVYSTRYIRQYARAIDFDESLILEHYCSVMGIKPEPEQIRERAAQAVGSFVSRFLRYTSVASGPQ